MKKVKNKLFTLKEKTFAKLDACAITLMFFLKGTPVYAADWDDAPSVPNNSADPFVIFGRVLGILTTVTRYAGAGVLIYGIYEVVTSFTQDMPDKRMKGIIFCLCAVVMIGMKSVINRALAG